MGTKSLLIVFLIWVIALHSTSAQQQFVPPAPTSPVSVDERFKIPEVTQDERYDPNIADWVAESVMRFAHDLGVVIDEKDFPNTQIFSPLSVMSALSILHMGANGNSYNQLSKLFHILAGEPGRDSWKIHEEFGWLLEDLMLNRKNLKRPRTESAWRKTTVNRNAFGTGGKNTPDDHTIRVANGLFVQEGFSLRPDYRYAAQSVYKSEVTPLNFRTQKDYAKHYINSWVNQNTLGKIPAIIADEVNSDTNMIIASALYFKGYWEQPFLGSGSAETDFFPDGPGYPPIRVVMMGTGGVFPYYDSPEYSCRIIGLPYKGNQTTMYVIQPYDSNRRNLQHLQAFLTGDKINELISKMERKTAVIAFPKFHVTNTLRLKDPLIKMGIEDVFFNGRSDLSLIAEAGRYTEQSSAPFPPPPSASLPPTSQASQLVFGVPATTNGQRVAPISTASNSFPDNQITSNIASQPAASRAPQQPSASTPDRPRLPTFELRPVASTPDGQRLPRPQPLSAVSERQSIQTVEPFGIVDRYNEVPLIFSRFSDLTNDTTRPGERLQMQWTQQGNLMTGRMIRQQRFKRTVTYKVESEFMRSNLPLRLKDLILSKRITKSNPGKKLSRSRRQAIPDSTVSLQNLDRMRFTPGLQKPQLYVDEILHKVDFNVNEQGTEAAAATLTYLTRSGTDVAFRCDTPFLLLVRHDPTKLPLFYGKVNIPLA